MVNVDVEVYAKGMYCPMPIVKLKKQQKRWKQDKSRDPRFHRGER